MQCFLCAVCIENNSDGGGSIIIFFFLLKMIMAVRVVVNAISMVL